jgi:hypothetical protein
LIIAVLRLSITGKNKGIMAKAKGQKGKGHFYLLFTIYDLLFYLRSPREIGKAVISWGKSAVISRILYFVFVFRQTLSVLNSV